MQYETAATIISDAATECGLITSDLSNPWANTVTDQNIILLTRLLRRVGRGLVRAFPWNNLQKTATFSTSDGTAEYALETDYARSVDGTHWNRTQQLPLSGPLGPQDWQLLKARSSTGSVQFLRLFNNKLNIHPTPTATETVAYEYISTYWARRNWEASTAYVVGDIVVNDSGKFYTCDTSGTSAASGGPTGTSTNIVDGTARWDYTAAAAGYGTSQTPARGTDTLLLEPELLISALAYRFLKTKGLPSDAALHNFQDAWAQATGSDGLAKVLVLSGGGSFDRFLDESNLPDTGYGS